MSLIVRSILDLIHYYMCYYVVEEEKTETGQPMTYADYRALKSGETIEIDNYNDVDKKTYVCTVCHYVYDGDVPFEELPEDWTCPVCNQPKSVF